MKLRPSPLLLGLIGVIIFFALALFVRLPQEITGQLERIAATRPVFGSQPVVVVADQRIFTLYAALNAAGFDREYPGLIMSPARQQVRAALDGKNLPSLTRLRPIFERVADYHLVVWVLQRGKPPEFGRAEPGWWVSTRAADFTGLAEALDAFYREADIPTLWQDVEPAYQVELARWQPLAESAEQDIRTYLRVSETPYRQLVIIPNLLDSYYSGNGPQIDDIAYVVAGPTETEVSLRGLIEHEALHSLIGPMLDRDIDQIPVAASRRLHAALKETMPSGYGSWNSMLEESLNRAINLRMLPDEQLRARQLDRLELEGFLLIKPFEQVLVAYEKSGQPFESYLPTLLECLNDLELSQRR